MGPIMFHLFDFDVTMDRSSMLLRARKRKSGIMGSEKVLKMQYLFAGNR